MAKEKKIVTPSKDLSELLKSIEKDIGGGSIARGKGSIVDVEVFSTRVAALDYVLGCGGIPRGRIIEIYGPESGGKTTTCLQIVKACQNHYFKDKKRYGVCAFIDAEHALDVKWAENIGVNRDELIIAQPETGEEVFEIAERLVDSGLIDLIVVDSVAALTPKEVLEGEMKDANMGALGRLMSKGLTKIKGKCNKSNTTVIFVNQLRDKLGVMFGNPEITPGGRALKFYSSIRIEIKKIAPIKEKDAIYAFRTRAKVIKNKVAPPFMDHEYDICVGVPPRNVYGIDEIYSLVEMSTKIDVCTKNGSFIRFGEENVGNGMVAAANNLRTNPDLTEKIRKATHDKMFGGMELRQNYQVDEDNDGLEDGILDGDDA